jgi:hypothetical protein
MGAPSNLDQPKICRDLGWKLPWSFVRGHGLLAASTRADNRRPGSEETDPKCGREIDKIVAISTRDPRLIIYG